MSAQSRDGLAAEVKRPSELSAEERATWLGLMAAQPPLRRAFFAPGFAEACEQAHGRARVAVLRRGGETVGFFPFQYPSAWHRRMGLAERIGGELCDHAGAILRPGVRLDPATLLGLCRLGGLFISHLGENQPALGLTAAEWRIGHVIDLAGGSAAYFAGLGAANKPFLLDTERRHRRLEKEYGAPEISITTRPEAAELDALIAAKRAQYARTAVGDPFADAAHQRLVRLLAGREDAACTPLLSTLTAGGRVLARHFGLMHAGVLSYWFPVYDPEASKVSPGRLLLWHTLRAADTHGIRLIDRGEGDSQAKRDFSTGEQRFGRASWYAGGWRGMLAKGCQKLTWMLRR